MFYFDSISFLADVFNQLLLLNESSIPHNGFKGLFPTVQEINHFMEVGWLKNNEIHGDVPVSDMRYAFRAS